MPTNPSLTQLAAATLKLLARLVDDNSPSETTQLSASGTQTIPVPGNRYKIGHFSTRNEDFYKHVMEVHGLVRDYAGRRSASKPLNLLISAPPGSGKSFLVKQMLARTPEHNLAIPYLELNISNIGGRSDLGAAWTFVQTMFANRITPCVFFDEIDSPVDGEYLLRDLIMPMNDAAVIHGGIKQSLGPAIFIFAGSKLFEPPPAARLSKGEEEVNVRFSAWSAAKEERIRALGSPPARAKGRTKSSTDTGATHNVPKVRDFLDRIDRFIVFPDAQVRFDGMGPDVLENEAIDLVLNMIGKHFPSVKCVEVTAAAALAASLRSGKTSKRTAERLVFTSIVSPNDEVFKFSNLTSEAQRLLSQEELAKKEAAYTGKAFKIE